MTLFNQFALSFGSLLTLQAVIAAWLFRTAAAPLWAKVAIPSLIVALGCYAPFAVASMLGYPYPVTMAQLPERAELVAFVAHDEDRRVDLWLRSGPVPRAYETELTAAMKKTLREAQEAKDHGKPAMLAKRGNQKTGAADDPLGIGDNLTIYELDPAALSALPPKE